MAAFGATFGFDDLLLAVTSTDPAVGSTIVLPLLSLVVNFNEPINPSSVEPGDLILSQGSAYAVNIIDTDSVEFLLQGIIAEATLTATIPAGVILDQFGFGNVEFVGTFELDFGTTPFPIPFAPVSPPGSLIYESTQAGRIGTAGDTDQLHHLGRRRADDHGAPGGRRLAPRLGDALPAARRSWAATRRRSLARTSVIQTF